MLKCKGLKSLTLCTLTSLCIYSPYCSLYILYVLTGRICKTIKSFVSCWSFRLFSWLKPFTPGWYCKEKLEPCHSYGLKVKESEGTDCTSGMDKDKNIHQETVTLDGERGGGGEVPPSLLLKVIWLLTAPFFYRRKETKKSRSLEKATLWVVLLCVLHYFLY